MFDITAIFKAVAEVFGFVNRRTDLKNAPDVREAKKRQDEQGAEEQETKAVADRNTEATQKGWSE